MIICFMHGLGSARSHFYLLGVIHMVTLFSLALGALGILAVASQRHENKTYSYESKRSKGIKFQVVSS
jgi:hypothetical protein